MTTADFPTSEELASLAIPPPPPPPPAPRPSGSFPIPGASSTPRDAVEAIARVSVLTDRLAGLERELVELQVFRRRMELGGAAPTSGGSSDGEVLALRAELLALRAENDRLRAQPGTGADPRVQADLDQARAEVARLKAEAADPSKSTNNAEVQKLKLENDRLLKDVERIEGEYQSLKILNEERAKKMERAASSALDAFQGISLDPEVSEKLKAIVAERDRLSEEKSKVDGELARIKGEATKKIKELKGELDKRLGESETMRLQKENLMKQLMARDSGDVKREITLEEITNSEVFKNMLGNIRRTSRMEVTHLHDAIAQLKEIDPKVYNLALDVVAKQFKKAAMENPLATLPRA